MKTLQLTTGETTLIDDEDFERVSQFRWSRSISKNSTYAMRSIWLPETKTKQPVYLYRFIIDAPKGMIVDHANGNTLDNRRSNLRLCTQMQNSYNRVPHGGHFKGVYRLPSSKNPFCAKIRANSTTNYLGSFATEIEAARAYDDAAKRLHKEFAYLNFPNG